MFKPDKKTVLLILLAVAVMGAMVYALYVTGMFDLLTDKKRLLQFIKENNKHAATLFIGLQIVQVVAAPLPGEVTGFVGGILFGPVWGVVYSTIGLTIGSWIAFMLARLLGRPIVERLASRELIERYDYVMKHKGLLLAFLMFLIPGFPKDILCYILGLGHMNQRDFLLVSASGRLLGTVLLTMGGTFFRDDQYGALFTVIGVSLLIILLAMMYHDRLERLLRRISGALRKEHDPD
ncbi:MAG: TVP38/TMEM64 family protein [Gammaproteobacteria bacterium]|nr:TVP38/TMEM64 family protein [Gammaproteobacteria bacterium]MDH3405857.1 TVP38/TMEM64 family protein [Gammaproteobacteria bacterium]MDH5487806.1 TVP38/TMEM64 family protein [Gammaproteobacteria bacterium]